MSLEKTYDLDNIFAKILRGEIPCVKLYENDHILSFMDAFPQSKGHALIIPKQASQNILGISPDDLSHVIHGTQKIAKAVEKALDPAGIILTQFNGAEAGQTVFHFHFHVIPRYETTQLHSHGSAMMADRDELEAIATLIRPYLQGI